MSHQKLIKVIIFKNILSTYLYYIQQQVQINPATGQPDYSQQWIDYYRSLGLMQEAEAVERQTKQQQQQQGMFICIVFVYLVLVL